MLNVEQFLALPDTEKPRFLCLPRTGGGSGRIRVSTGLALFCTRCGSGGTKTRNAAGDETFKAIGKVGEPDEWCFDCFRIENIDTVFRKD